MSSFAKNPLRILLLEDSRFDAEFIGEFVRVNYPLARMLVVDDEAGFTGALAAGLDGQPFDLILSDYEVPGYGGPQALDFVRATVPETPFIFVSGVIGEENAVDMLKRGATDYVSKNRLSRLPVVVDRALQEVAQRQARDDAERVGQSKADTLAALAQELRETLTPVASAVRLLQDNDGVRDDYRELLATLRHHVAAAVDRIDDVLGPPALSPHRVRPGGSDGDGSSRPVPSVRMLLVEDNEDAAFAMAASFEYYGYHVTHAATLRTALAAARDGRFDVIVADLGLPDGNGIELAEAMASRVPMIALSGHGDAEDMRRTAAAGFLEHLVKPADPQHVHDVVTKVLARAAA